MEIEDKLSTSDGSLGCINLSEDMIQDILKWISEQNTILNVPHESGETNIGHKTEMHNFIIYTEYTFDYIEVTFTNDDGTLITTRRELEEAIK